MDSPAIVIMVAVTAIVAVLAFILYSVRSTIRKAFGRLTKPKPLIKPCPPMPRNGHKPLPNRDQHVPFNENAHEGFTFDESFLAGHFRHIRDWAVRNNYPAQAIHLTPIAEANEAHRTVYFFYRIEVDLSLIPNAQVARLNRETQADFNLIPLADRRPWTPHCYPPEFGTPSRRAQRAGMVTVGQTPTEPAVATFRRRTPALVVTEPEMDLPPAYEETETFSAPPSVRAGLLNGTPPQPVANPRQATPLQESSTPGQSAPLRESEIRENLEALEANQRFGDNWHSNNRLPFDNHQPFDNLQHSENHQHFEDHGHVEEHHYYESYQHFGGHEHVEEHQYFESLQHFAAPRRLANPQHYGNQQQSAAPEHFDEHEQFAAPQNVDYHHPSVAPELFEHQPHATPEHSENHQQVSIHEPTAPQSAANTNGLLLEAPQPLRPAYISRFHERFEHETDPDDLARYL